MKLELSTPYYPGKRTKEFIHSYLFADVVVVVVIMVPQVEKATHVVPVEAGILRAHVRVGFHG